KSRTDVAHDADDLISGTVELKSSAQGVPARPVFLRQRLVDNRDTRGLPLVCLAKGPAGEHGHAECLEESRAHALGFQALQELGTARKLRFRRHDRLSG